MKAVLMSIKPKWVELILNGKKTIEVRKTAPKLKPPFKVYVYETKGKTEIPWVDEDGHFVYQGRGEVIAEFVCDYEYDLFPFGMGSGVELNGELVSNEIFCNQCCLTEQEICDYIGMRDGVGLHISELKEYDKPKKLSEFVKPTCIYGEGNEQCTLCDKSGYNEAMRLTCYNSITRAPQSWCYIEEIEV